jgi:hypothetical protein
LLQRPAARLPIKAKPVRGDYVVLESTPDHRAGSAIG